MPATDIDPVMQVLAEVNDWPAGKRLDLIQRILQTVQSDFGGNPSRKKPLKDLLGILQTNGPPLSDEDRDRILYEELLRKHGP